MTKAKKTWGDVPKTDLLPLGNYLLKFGKDWSDDDSSTGKAMVKIPFIVVPHGEIPTHYHGKTVTAWYVLASVPGGPICSAQGTGTIALRNLFDNAQVPLDDVSLDPQGLKDLMEIAADAQFVARITTPKPKDDREPMNRVGACWTVEDGEERIGLDEPEEEMESSAPEPKAKTKQTRGKKPATDTGLSTFNGFMIPNADVAKYAIMSPEEQKTYRDDNNIQPAE
jgi:hypothetical protein